MSGTSISWLQIAASILCAREQTQEYVLASLWDGSCHISFFRIIIIIIINSLLKKLKSYNVLVLTISYINKNIIRDIENIISRLNCNCFTKRNSFSQIKITHT